MITTKKVEIHGYQENNRGRDNPMIHILGTNDEDYVDMLFTPKDARLVAEKMIEFCDRIEGVETMKWGLPCTS